MLAFKSWFACLFSPQSFECMQDENNSPVLLGSGPTLVQFWFRLLHAMMTNFAQENSEVVFQTTSKWKAEDAMHCLSLTLPM